MTIYLAFFQSFKQHPIPAYKFWEFYIKNGIEEAGHTWVESKVDWAEAMVYHLDKPNIDNWKSRTWETVLKDITKISKKQKIDFFLSYFYPLHIEQQAIKQIQKLGIPCVNFFCDNVREYTKVPQAFHVFDLNWVPEYKALEMYRKAKVKFVHLPMPMWVEPQNRNIALVENQEVSFIGSKDIQRLLLFEELTQKDFDFHLYGAGWQQENVSEPNFIPVNSSVLQKISNQFDFIAQTGLAGWLRKINQRNLNENPSDNLEAKILPKPTFDQYLKITKESIVTLGVNRYPSFRFPLQKPDNYSRLRDIEAPMLGACYLTEWTEGLDEMYEIGKEIEVYRDADELIEKVKELKQDHQKRNKLRINGQKKALEKLCINQSISKILEKL
jgi:hypothetical protein